MISVVIPTFRERGLLKQSIDSAINQNYPCLEVLVVDDNHPDSEERKRTEKVMDFYKDKSNVIYIKHDENKNGAAARNTGIRFSHGEYIAFLDDDDSFLPGKLIKQYNFMKEHPEFSAVYCFAMIDKKQEPTYPYTGNAILPLLNNRTKMFTPTLFFTRSSLIAIGGFDESFKRHQDYELLIKFFDKGYKIGCLQEYLTEIHPIGGNRLSSKKLEELKNQYLKTFESTIEEIDKERPGSKKQIIANNYASVFISHLADKNFDRALRVFSHYFIISPIDFMSYLWFFTKSYMTKKWKRVFQF